MNGSFPVALNCCGLGSHNISQDSNVEGAYCIQRHHISEYQTLGTNDKEELLAFMPDLLLQKHLLLECWTGWTFGLIQLVSWYAP